MKQYYLGFIFFILSTLGLAANNTLNVYNWAQFMPNKIIKEFEKSSGIHVNYTEFDSNETLYAKLKANPHIGYDVIVPSSYYLQRMAREGMLREFKPSDFSNFHYLNPLFTGQRYDPQNHYSLPYLWGTTGIVVNDQYWNPNSLHQWKDLWQPRFKNQLLMLDDSREVFSLTFISLGYSVNDTNPDHIREAFNALVELKKNVKVFNTDADIAIYADEDATVGMGWSGDLRASMLENSHLHYIYPEDGFTIWVDCLAIPKFAPHYDNALKFLNFILRPEIAEQITESIGYSSPNMAGNQLLPKALRDNPIINPSGAVLKRGHFQIDVGDASALYEKYWQLLKIST